MAVKYSVADDGLLKVLVATDNYKSLEHFINQGGFYLVMRAAKDVIAAEDPVLCRAYERSAEAEEVVLSLEVCADEYEVHGFIQKASGRSTYIH